MLTDLGFNEEMRRIIHRLMAIIMIAASIYHVVFLTATQRGRKLLWAILPKWRDFSDARNNMMFRLGFTDKRPIYEFYDYTQKAEYWALIWGTAIMCLTGLVLWFPTFATNWLPVWAVRVCEVVHFYEAILAVSAIIVWHLFYVIFLPREYPMNWAWITGNISEKDWQEHHSEETEIKPETFQGTTDRKQ